MVYRFRQPCKNTLCAHLTAHRSGFCASCRQSQETTTTNKDRSTSCQRGYDRRWRAARVAFLRNHPFCVFCLNAGRYTPATVIDHIIPHQGNQAKFWDQGNWQALCKRCHDSDKRVQELEMAKRREHEAIRAF